MKKSFASLLAGSLFIPMTSVLAETIVYDGLNTTLLQNAPGWAAGSVNSLFPGSMASPADSRNSVTVTGGTIAGDVFGGLSQSGDVTHNTANIKGGNIGGDVYGGYSNSGIVTHNTANINGGSVGMDVYGGYSRSSDVTHNTVNINAGNVGAYVYGGYSSNGNTTYNTVALNGGRIDRAVFGGESVNGNATHNTVTLNGSIVDWSVLGGYSDRGIVTRNTVTLNDGSVDRNVYGGYSDSGIVTHNEVVFNDGSVTDHVYGGESSTGDATDNTVTLNSGSVGMDVYGGYSDSGTATRNTVNINGGTIAGYVYGGSSTSGNVTQNTVTLNGGRVAQDVYGGYSSSGIATDNTVTLNGGRVDWHVYGGTSSIGTATHNTVTLNGSIVSGNIYGGNGSSSATHNTVTLNAGIVSGNIYGGYSSGSATHNTVTLNGGTVSGTVYGGSKFTGSGDVFTGNTFNVAGRHTLGGLANFQFLNFVLPGDMAAGDILITSTGAVTLGNGSGIDSTVGISMAGGRSALTAGDTVTLISAASPISGNIANTTASGSQGMFLRYEWDNIAVSGNTLTARVVSASLNPQTHTLLQGRSAQSAILTQGADLVAGAGLQSMLMSARLGNRSFIAMQGGSSRYQTGSGVNIDSFSLMAGAAWAHKINPDTEMALGAFVETGTGSYHSSNSFTNLPALKGSGNTDYIGVGLIGNIESSSGLHADAALRIGRVTSDFNTDLHFGSERAEYDAANLYIGAHLGAGYKLALTKADTLDLYGRYSWNHVDSENVTVLGDKYHFDASDSHRLRGGLRYARTIGNLMPYGGIAYEYELDGKAKGSVYGYNLKETDMGGGTVIGELGLSWVPAAKDNLRVDIALEGFSGKRDGVMANARLNYRF